MVLLLDVIQKSHTSLSQLAPFPTCNSHQTTSLLTATWPRKGSGAKCEKCPENSFAEKLWLRGVHKMSTGQQGTCRFHLPHQLHLRRRSSGQSNRTVDSLFNLAVCSLRQHVSKSLLNCAGHAKVCTINGFIAHFTQWSITSIFTRLMRLNDMIYLESRQF